MRIVTAKEFQDWLSHGEVLEKDSHGAKVVRLADGRLLKVFRSRRLPLLVKLLPEAIRFENCAARLQGLGIRTPNIRETCWIDRSKAVSACIYEPLAGQSLDRIFRDDRLQFNLLLPQLAAYIYSMHRRGIYFRSLHLGNILRTPDNNFGLIDFLDIRFKGRPLGPMLVRRNFEHLRRYLQRRNVENFPIDELLLAYAEASKVSS
ncbi:MAG: toluene tolerance protein [Gammaproteobacteria bacterium]|nr:toluene tolerance protein [Gammaproteobacteria bacterium]MBU2154869.1 toluene tolerance protein [Gammaproteobacteria bacterium]MBU2255652.1 toluene tolerance protein [Gammaproteobacteria bacterium]MBU2296530.1 toluene tolerance protein [Gammaproteobacteria bacterium]